MDLQVGSHVVFDRNHNEVIPFAPLLLDPYLQDAIEEMFTDRFELPLYLPPMQRALLSTRLSVSIPSGKTGLIYIRSTWARLGLIGPATYADPKFEGILTLAVFNSSHARILVRPSDKIWSLILVPTPDEPNYTGRYQHQRELTLPKALTND